MKLRLILINHFTAKVKNADLVDVRKLKRQNNNSYKKNKSLFHQQRGKKTQHPIISSILVGIYDNSPTDNWPTRQLSDGTFSPTTNSPTRPLADTTSHRHFFKKLTGTRRHSPTETFQEKGWKWIFFLMSILLYFRNEHITTLLSVNTNTCTCVMASFSLYGYWNKVYSLYPYTYIQSFDIHTWIVENGNQFCKEI